MASEKTQIPIYGCGGRVRQDFLHGLQERSLRTNFLYMVCKGAPLYGFEGSARR